VETTFPGFTQVQALDFEFLAKNCHLTRHNSLDKRPDRLSCHRFLANAFRLLLHGCAYNLVNLFRMQLPQPWRSAQIETLRAQLFKIGARVRQTARCIHFHLATGWPFPNLFCSVVLAANSG
jgi:hypothetical protein